MANLETWLAEENSIIQKADNDKQAYLYEWLERLDGYLKHGNQVELKKVQPKIVLTLHKILEINCTPATRQRLAQCFATIYNVGTTSGLFDTVNNCLELIKSRDDSTHSPIKLSAICCMASIYEKLGRMVGTLFDACLQVLVKLLHKSEAQAKCEILFCFEKMLFGMGHSARDGFKDIYKSCKGCLSDKSMPVRCAAAKCALELSKNAQMLCTTELDAMVSVCLKSLEGSNYDVRMIVAQLLGVLMAGSQSVAVTGTTTKVKKISIEDMFTMMATAFLKGGTGFLKSGSTESNSNREIRVGVTQAYVIFFQEMGSKWVSKYLAGIIIHILELVASQKSTATHIDAVYSRKCISFILNSVLCGMLSENLQVLAIKELCKVITKQMNSIHEVISGENTSDSYNINVRSSQHVLVCALTELSNLVLALTSSVKNIINDTIVVAVFSTLIHPAASVWLTAAWCIRSCCIALPQNMTHLIDVCTKKMKSLRSSSEAFMGYGYTLAAIIGGLYKCPLGIPCKKSKALFTLGMEILKGVGNSGKIHQVQTGWVLMGSLCTLGPSFMKNCLPQLVDLFTSVFPLTGKDAGIEKGRGNIKTWQLTLENRACSICCMASFITHCKSLLLPAVLKKLMVPIEAGINSLSQFQSLVKIHGAQLKSAIVMFKVRLYHLLTLLSPTLYEAYFTPVLRYLASDFTLLDQGSTTTSLLQSLCHKDDSILLGSWVQETDCKDVEEQLQLNSASGSGALEHDPSQIYARCSKGVKIPGPLPLGVAVVDTAILLFGQVFPFVHNKHRGQLMSHFIDCIMKNKGARQQAIQTNIFTAFLAALKNLSDNKSSFGEAAALTHAKSLVQDALANPNNILRCAAGEALGRLAQVMNDQSFVAQMAQHSFEKCQKTSDALVRTGHALSLGCLHRYVGGMGSGHHLGNSVSVLIALAKDISSSLVQVWSLHGLTLIADSGGPMFRTFVDQSLYTVINLLLTTAPSNTEVHHCLSKCMGSLITATGPELQDSSKMMERFRMFCMTACSIMQNHPDSFVQAEGIRCLQRLHMFAPNVMNITSLVPHLCNNLLSSHLLLRKASVDCLRQLAHREAKEISQLGRSIIENNEEVKKKMFIAHHGLEGLLFSMLDSEVEERLLKHIREIITSLLQALAAKELRHWMMLCKQVLLASNDNDEVQVEKAGEDDDEEGQIVLSSKVEVTPLITPKWPTRVFAMECIRMLMEECKGHEHHMDLSVARMMKEKHAEDEYLVTQLSELVRLAFIAGTSSNDLLKLQGMKALQDVVVLFASVPDPDIEGHLILEQFQAQVGTALRPAFAENVPPDITAMACEVCSSWIGCGISRDVNDVRRIQQLLVTSLERIGDVEDMYNESSYTLEQLAVLKAWAQIYIMAVKDDKSDDSSTSGRLLDLVEKDLKLLAKHWIGAARDYVILTLPAQYESQLPAHGGAFYNNETLESVRPHYRQSWSPIVHAIALWLATVAFNNPEQTFVGAGDELPSKVTVDALDKSAGEVNKDRFHLVCGICMEAMCSPLSTYPTGTLETCVRAVGDMLDTEFGRQRIVSTKPLCIELLTVLHRLLLSRNESHFQMVIMDIVHKCSLALSESTDNKESSIKAKESVVFTIMEICTYLVKRYASSVMPANCRGTVDANKTELSSSVLSLLGLISTVLATIPVLCTPLSSVHCLPTVLFLLTSLLKYIALNANDPQADHLRTAFAIIARSYKRVVTCEYAVMNDVKEKWKTFLQSCLFSTVQTLNSCASYTESNSVDLLVWENMLLIISLFLLYSPLDYMMPLLNDCVQEFASVIENAPPKLRLPAVKIVENIVKSADRELSIPFIHNCVPYVLCILEEAITMHPSCDVELNCCKTSVNLLEVLLGMVDEEKRVNIMELYVPTLVNLLHDSKTLGKANSFARSLHDFCIQRITVTGPLYPAAFKICLSNKPELKARLTAGIQANKNIKTRRALASTGRNSPQMTPQIQLKMNFTNFK